MSSSSDEEDEEWCIKKIENVCAILFDVGGMWVWVGIRHTTIIVLLCWLWANLRLKDGLSWCSKMLLTIDDWFFFFFLLNFMSFCSLLTFFSRVIVSWTSYFFGFCWFFSSCTRKDLVGYSDLPHRYFSRPWVGYSCFLTAIRLTL